MKKKFSCYVPVVIFGLLALSCQHAHSDTVRAFASGTFVRAINNEFTKGSDSLVIKPLDAASVTYLIEHRSGYRQHIEGKDLPFTRKVEKWTAVYDADHSLLRVEPQGKVFILVPDKGVLVSSGGTEYQKLP